MKNTFLSHTIHLLLGLLITFIGFVHCFWGNDPFFGYMITLLSMIFYAPVIQAIAEKIHPKIFTIIKVVLVLFILWASLGVGEFFVKIDMMKHSFPTPKFE